MADFKTAKALALVAMLMVSTAQAQASCADGITREAASIRQLDTMLMVGALRCRSGDPSLIESYNSFVRIARPRVSAANAQMRAWFTTRGTGLNGYDRHGTVLANRYGGQDGITCSDMRMALHLATRAAERPQGLAQLVKDLQLTPDVPGSSCAVQIAKR